MVPPQPVDVDKLLKEVNTVNLEGERTVLQQLALEYEFLAAKITELQENGASAAVVQDLKDKLRGTSLVQQDEQVSQLHFEVKLFNDQTTLCSLCQRYPMNMYISQAGEQTLC